MLSVISVLVTAVAVCVTAGETESCGTSPYPDAGMSMSRIINGRDARPNEFPWQVSMQHRNRHFCGGTVLSERFVLTAAHCVAGGYRYMCSMSVLAGAHNKSADELTQQRVNFKNITIFPGWDRRTTRGDIAVVELDSSLTLSETTVAACLPDRPHACYVGEEAVISGWGAAYQDEDKEFTHPDLLQYARIQIKPLKFCADFAENTTMTHYVQPDMFCLSGTGYARNRSACHGDSGGPLAVKDGNKWVILGATTFGFTFGGLKGCIQGAPFFYRSVPYYASWIREQMQQKT